MREFVARMLGSPSAWFRWHKRKAAYHMAQMGVWRDRLPAMSCGTAKTLRKDRAR
jgi:hypothetical protein